MMRPGTKHKGRTVKEPATVQQTSGCDPRQTSIFPHSTFLEKELSVSYIVTFYIVTYVVTNCTWRWLSWIWGKHFPLCALCASSWLSWCWLVYQSWWLVNKSNIMRRRRGCCLMLPWASLSMWALAAFSIVHKNPRTLREIITSFGSFYCELAQQREKAEVLSQTQGWT